MANKKSNIEKIVALVISFGCALLIGSIFLVAEGENPLAIYKTLFIQPFSSVAGITKVLTRMTPLLFAGLAVMIAFKCNVFNIGVEGQLYVGALAAAIAGYFGADLPAVIHIPLCMICAMAAGALYAFVPALLKVKLNVHEVVSTIMMNYIANCLIGMIVVKYFRAEGPVAKTPDVAEGARLPMLSSTSQLNIGVIIAVALVAVLCFVFKRTSLGWRIEASGKNMIATTYSGVNGGKIVIMTMMISGAIAALAGVERILGNFGYMEVGFSPGYGWDGITIAIIAANHPVGVLLMSLLLGVMSYGGDLVSVTSKIPVEWVSLLSALIFIFVVLGRAVLAMLEKRRKGGHIR